MGFAETAALEQAKQTNKRLDALIAEQQRTNELLSRLIQAVEAVGGLPPYQGQPPQV